MKRRLIRGSMYLVEYYDHFEDDVLKSLTLKELGFFLDEDERYYYFCGYMDSAGGNYNRSGVLKEMVISVKKLRM